MSNAGYEKRDVSIKSLVGATLAIVLIIVVFIVLLRDFFVANVEKAVYEEAVKNPSVSLAEIKKNEEQLLNNFNIIDKENGVYQIPVELAMDLVVREYNR
jgi:anionic cell wall polymer biosynthesis LytR-Cps2A-Psr (LCP) family protein